MQSTSYKTSVAQKYAFGIVGESPSMKRIRKIVEHAGRNGASVLISGKTGTGKEIVAMGIYEARQFQGPLITVNTCAISDGLAESELFGHVRGAFTGAITGRRGFFELAHDGILFLDEIGDMPLGLQAKLLRAIESGIFYPVGSEKPVAIQTKIVAATNQDLGELIERGKFREDLYHRLRTVEIKLPNLEERIEDIPELICHFLELYNHAHSSKISITDKAIECLCQRATELIIGNVRGLRVFVECAATFANEGVVDENNFAFTGKFFDSETIEPPKPRELPKTNEHAFITAAREWIRQQGPFKIKMCRHGLRVEDRAMLERRTCITIGALERLLDRKTINDLVHEERKRRIEEMRQNGTPREEYANVLGIEHKEVSQILMRYGH